MSKQKSESTRRHAPKLGRWSVCLLAPLAVALIVACGTPADQEATNRATPSANASELGDSATTEPTVAPPTPRSTTEADVPDPNQELLDDVVAKVLVSDGAALAVIIDADGDIVEASIGTGADGRAPLASDRFRVGSITKIFTALATLSLVEDGVIALESPASNYISRVEMKTDPTVRDLLQHTSGNYDVGSPDVLFEDSERVWAPEEILEVWLTRTPREPGSGFTYSTSNYYLLGILIEEVTGQPYDEAIRQRIIEPLGLIDTYVAPDGDRLPPFDPYLPRGQEGYDYTSIATGTWSAGAMVSSAGDLHTLFTALFDEQILSREMVDTMIAGDSYGLGIRLWDESTIGHDGFTPGYNTLVAHSIETGTTAFLASTDDLARTVSAGRTMLDGLRGS